MNTELETKEERRQRLKMALRQKIGDKHSARTGTRNQNSQRTPTSRMPGSLRQKLDSAMAELLESVPADQRAQVQERLSNKIENAVAKKSMTPAALTQMFQETLEFETPPLGNEVCPDSEDEALPPASDDFAEPPALES